MSTDSALPASGQRKVKGGTQQLLDLPGAGTPEINVVFL